MERRAVGHREDGKLEQNVGREDGKEIGWEIRDKSSDYDCIRWEKLCLSINPLPHLPPALAPAGLGRCPPGLSCRSTRGIGATGTQQEGREQCGARSAWGGGEVESRGNWTLYISKIFIQLRLTCVNNIQQSKLFFFSPSSPKSLFPHPRLLVLLLLLLLLQEHFPRTQDFAWRGSADGHEVVAVRSGGEHVEEKNWDENRLELVIFTYIHYISVS